MIECTEAEAKSPGCIAAALSIIGDRWTARILKELVEQPRRFSEIEAKLGGISPRTLSQRLTSLEENSIIDSKLYCEHPQRYQYELTVAGRDLVKVLVAMAAWGKKYSSVLK
jgi:DNA-binding HxlR family transcriptional regulator